MLPRGTENGVKDQRIFCLLFIFFTSYFPLGKLRRPLRWGTLSPETYTQGKKNWGSMLALIDIHNTRQMS